MVPSTAVLLRDGSFALALFGRMRKVQLPPFISAGRESFAWKQILEAFLVISLNSERAAEPPPAIVGLRAVVTSENTVVTAIIIKGTAKFSHLSRCLYPAR